MNLETNCKLSADAPSAHRDSYIIYGDILRIFGATAVALIHLSEPFVKSYDSVSRLDWWFCNFIISWARSAVPLFIMLSGAILLHSSKIEPIKVFYRKRLRRIGIPLVFWSVFYLTYEILYGKTGLTIHQALQKTALGQPSGHLYFLFAIAGLYLFTPVIWIYITHAARRELFFGIILLFILWTAGYLAASFAYSGGMGGNAFTKFVPYLGYFLLGYYLRDTFLSDKAFAFTCLLCIGSVVFTMLGTYFLVFQIDIARHLILSRALSPTMIITSITLFLIISNVVYRRERKKTRNTLSDASRQRNMVHKLASATMGVYLIHLWFAERVLGGWADRALAWIAEHAHILIAKDWHDRVWICIPIATFVILAVSYTITFIIGRIPYVRRIVGL